MITVTSTSIAATRFVALASPLCRSFKSPGELFMLLDDGARGRKIFLLRRLVDSLNARARLLIQFRD